MDKIRFITRAIENNAFFFSKIFNVFSSGEGVGGGRDGLKRIKAKKENKIKCPVSLESVL